MANLAKVFDADNGAEAELIREALEAAGLSVTIENQPSPLDGLTAMGQGTPVYVAADQVDQANAIIGKFIEESMGSDEEE